MKITSNSKGVKKGDIFYARAGEKFDGHNFVSQAIEQGASEIIHTKDLSEYDPSVKYHKVASQEDLIKILKKHYTLPDNIFYITGTNGKTSIVHFAREILSKLGHSRPLSYFKDFTNSQGNEECGADLPHSVTSIYHSSNEDDYITLSTVNDEIDDEYLEKNKIWNRSGSASIGTVGIILNGKKILDNSLTTPDICDLYYALSKIKEQGCDNVFIEASSIALDQGRISGLNGKVVGFNNFSLDHLDYHKTTEHYFDSKIKLLTDHSQREILLKKKIEELLTDEQRDKLKNKNITITDELIQYENFHHRGGKTYVMFIYDKKEYYLRFDTILPRFQIDNTIFAIAFILKGFPEITFKEIAQILGDIHPPEGRMQFIRHLNGLDYFVDFAHTEDALEKSLEFLQEIYKKEEIAVIFGCGGDRDNAKRVKMAQVAEKLANYVIITNDNPRTEDPQAIADEVSTGFSNIFKKENTSIILNRGTAIKSSKELALKGVRVVLIAGKGHETTQVIGKASTHFSDIEEVQNLE